MVQKSVLDSSYLCSVILAYISKNSLEIRNSRTFFFFFWTIGIVFASTMLKNRPRQN